MNLVRYDGRPVDLLLGTKVCKTVEAIVELFMVLPDEAKVCPHYGVASRQPPIACFLTNTQHVALTLAAASTMNLQIPIICHKLDVKICGGIICHQLCVVFECEHTMTLPNHGHPLDFGSAGKRLTGQCACLSFYIFWTNKAKVIEFRAISIF